MVHLLEMYVTEGNTKKVNSEQLKWSSSLKEKHFQMKH
jgi:hypothetical protein